MNDPADRVLPLANASVCGSLNRASARMKSKPPSFKARSSASPTCLRHSGKGSSTSGSRQESSSGQVVQILDYLGVDYKGVNVLTSDELRQGIKEYSNWPTIPQLYVKGEFVGGCDIVREMFQSGELQSFLDQKGVSVKAA